MIPIILALALVLCPLSAKASSEQHCLALNIFHEAASEPLEGQVAVAMVTLNRVLDGRWGSSVCAVINHRRVVRQRVVTVPQLHGYSVLNMPTHRVTQTITQTVCQFSWRCAGAKPPKPADPRWQQAQEVASDMLSNSEVYDHYRTKYQRALYFHSVRVRPAWSRQQRLVAVIGGHRFYAEPETKYSYASL